MFQAVLPVSFLFHNLLSDGWTLDGPVYDHTEDTLCDCQFVNQRPIRGLKRWFFGIFLSSLNKQSVNLRSSRSGDSSLISSKARRVHDHIFFATILTCSKNILQSWLSAWLIGRIIHLAQPVAASLPCQRTRVIRLLPQGHLNCLRRKGTVDL
jgi:hypothetical protein